MASKLIFSVVELRAPLRRAVTAKKVCKLIISLNSVVSRRKLDNPGIVATSRTSSKPQNEQLV